MSYTIHIMPEDLTREQIEKLLSLGISVNSSNNQDVIFPLHQGGTSVLSKRRSSKYLPLLTISGITLISFSGIILLKNQNSETTPGVVASASTVQTASVVSPTSAPTTIQSYLLLSQQYFTSAVALQGKGSADNQEVVGLLNQAILSASNAIQDYPNDYRGYYQRGRIYQSLLDSKPELASQALADFTAANKINPNSADITRDLASIYARQGDVANTLTYLSQTVSIEPTKAQNFYDLAKIQQQTGQIKEALSTYDRLLPLITDQAQMDQLMSEKATLETIMTQNPTYKSATATSNTVSPTPSITFTDNPPKLQASNSSGLIIAASETRPEIAINNITNSNSLSGTATLPTNTKEITLKNTNLTSTSQVYVTILKGGKNQNLQVLSKSTTDFTVGLDSAISESIEFKWWIIN